MHFSSRYKINSFGSCMNYSFYYVFLAFHFNSIQQLIKQNLTKSQPKIISDYNTNIITKYYNEYNNYNDLILYITMWMNQSININNHKSFLPRYSLLKIDVFSCNFLIVSLLELFITY